MVGKDAATTKRPSFRISENDHRRLKAVAALKGVGLKEVVQEAFQNYFESDPVASGVSNIQGRSREL